MTVVLTLRRAATVTVAVTRAGARKALGKVTIKGQGRQDHAQRAQGRQVHAASRPLPRDRARGDDDQDVHDPREAAAG
jgi:hypothetical protein